ncbi:hypothetical protein JK358_35565 [Nocardia sp. 2]|uniref:Uncharacterized protein n=1 Tax=Nocardia acididurans TaxID=2802282 RepID=A0ABS1MKF5_9NOCA|nr:hypothetical protein [Nocardia acididurans]MBL1079733.1 hypothetical protein [Nocardia acididurans]
MPHDKPTHPGDWYCDGYGAPPAVAGAWCFVAELYTRTCADPAECHRQMTAARQRAYRMTSERAAAGDPVAVEMAKDLARPEQFHGGDDPLDPETGR